MPQEYSQQGFNGREKVIFITVLILHVLVIGFFAVQFESTPQTDELNINLVDEPSVGPKVAPVTTRREYSPEPPKESAPAPIPEPEAPDLPDLPPVPATPPAPAEPNFNAPPLPAPRKVSEPKVARLPRPPRRNTTRKLTTTKTTVRKTGTNNNEFVPIGKEDLAQMFGEKPSNTPQGGPKTDAGYKQKFAAYLKMHWPNYQPSRAELGNAWEKREFRVRIDLHIDGSGRTVSWQLRSSTGNAVMDRAIMRMFENLTQFPAPDGGKPFRMSNESIVFELT